MKICFYGGHHYYGGLANNGGSRTILLSAKTLREMGHEVVIVACADKFDWFKHPDVLNEIPKDTDVCIAISVSDIKPMVNLVSSNTRIAYWARPFENWQMPEETIKKRLHYVVNLGGVVMANSQWQIDWMRNIGVNATLVYNGLDFNDWRENVRVRGRFATVGVLYHKMATKRWRDWAVVKKFLGDFEFNERIMGLKPMVGERLVDFYNQCDIWFAPTEREGFHNVPAEANLCGCLVVCGDIGCNGCMDYCNPETAHIYKSLEEAAEFIKNPDFSRVPRMQKLLMEKIGSRTENMIKLLEAVNG